MKNEKVKNALSGLLALVLGVVMTFGGVSATVLGKGYFESKEMNTQFHKAFSANQLTDAPSYYEALKEETQFRVISRLDKGNGTCSAVLLVRAPYVLDALCAFGDSLTDIACVSDEELESKIEEIIRNAPKKTKIIRTTARINENGDIEPVNLNVLLDSYHSCMYADARSWVTFAPTYVQALETNRVSLQVPYICCR